MNFVLLRHNQENAGLYKTRGAKEKLLREVTEYQTLPNEKILFILTTAFHKTETFNTIKTNKK